MIKIIESLNINLSQSADATYWLFTALMMIVALTLIEIIRRKTIETHTLDTPPPTGTVPAEPRDPALPPEMGLPDGPYFIPG